MDRVKRLQTQVERLHDGAATLASFLEAYDVLTSAVANDAEVALCKMNRRLDEVTSAVLDDMDRCRRNREAAASVGKKPKAGGSAA